MIDLWVCWSIAELVKHADRRVIMHLQGENGRTLCGIEYGALWDYELHRNTSIEHINCQRCVKRYKAQLNVAG